jgi:hypothetical protein
MIEICRFGPDGFLCLEASGSAIISRDFERVRLGGYTGCDSTLLTRPSPLSKKWAGPFTGPALNVF